MRNSKGIQHLSTLTREAFLGILDFPSRGARLLERGCVAERRALNLIQIPETDYPSPGLRHGTDYYEYCAEKVKSSLSNIDICLDNINLLSAGTL